jgi:acetylornithine deacetylase/succinyl-diaminopimelate desuccinylase-like protein
MIRLAALRLLLLSLLAAACVPTVTAAPATAPPAAVQEWLSDRLFFGRDIPDGGSVSEQDWTTFLAEVVTPRFSDGLTVLHGEGQWLGANGAVVSEPSFIVEVNHPPSATVDAALDEIAAEYKRRFRQEAVMRVRIRAEVEFHD